MISLTRLWTIVDLAIIIMSVFITISVIDQDLNGDIGELGYKDKHYISTSTMRVIEAIGVLFIWFKALYFLQLIP